MMALIAQPAADFRPDHDMARSRACPLVPDHTYLRVVIEPTNPHATQQACPLGRRAVEKRRTLVHQYDRDRVGKKLHWTMRGPKL